MHASVGTRIDGDDTRDRKDNDREQEDGPTTSGKLMETSVRARARHDRCVYPGKAAAAAAAAAAAIAACRS